MLQKGETIKGYTNRHNKKYIQSNVKIKGEKIRLIVTFVDIKS